LKFSRFTTAFSGLSIGAIALFRVLGLVISFSVSLAVIAVLSGTGSPQSFAAYALIASVINLLPFADLGLGASVVNLASDFRAGKLSETSFGSGFRKAVGILAVISVGLTILFSVLYAHDILDVALGSVATAPWAAEGFFVSAVLVVLAIPFGLGARVLQGLGQMRIVAKVALVGPILQALFLVPVLVFRAPSEIIFVAPAVAYFVVAVWQSAVARRAVKRVVGLPTPPHGLQSRQVHLLATAAPFLLISVALALSYQSHRILLANIAPAGDVAQYAAAAQFVGPLVALVSLVGQNLWSTYRSETEPASSRGAKFGAHVLGFGGIGVLFAVGFAIFAPVLVRFVSGHVLDIPTGLVLSAVMYIVVSAVHQPSAMYLTNSSGLWMQAGMTLLVAAATVTFILSLTDQLGPASPYAGLAICMLFLQVIPSYLIVRNRMSRSA
jgi:O-antigen/teichoic acid export membrane protein